MAESLFSPSWYRISKLQPRVRKHAQIHRHYYSGELWYVLQDHATGQFYRFTPVVYYVIGLMDGVRTVQELWEKAAERFGDEAPTQNDMVRLLSQLHSADVLVSDKSPDMAELSSRSKKVKQSKLKQYLGSPLSWRFPLFDPEVFLGRSLPYVRPLFGRVGFILWLAVMIAAMILTARHWPELTENVTDRVLSAQNLFLVWLIYPVIKIIHEFGHAYAVKKWGGEVHEMGVMLLVLMPVPYVDATASSAFREKGQRILVGAAGMMVELFAASIALFVWLVVEPGMVRSVAYNIFLIGSISTVLFNGNPLLRYDGYYMFADLMEMPNLAQRSSKYLMYLLKRYLFGVKSVESPYVEPGKRFWLLTYAIASFVYRLVIYAAIILFISQKLFVIGVLMGIWALFGMTILPAVKGLRFLLASPVLNEKRFRSVSITAGILLAFFLLVFVLPVPSWTRTEGIIWVPEESVVRAATNGFVSRIVARPGTHVEKGDILVECRDPQLVADVQQLQAQLNALEAQYYDEINTDRVKAKITQEEMGPVRANLERAEERLNELTIHSPGDGQFVLPMEEDLPGLFLKQGELIGYVITNEKPTVRVVVTQSDVDLIRERTREVAIRLADRIDQVIPAVIKRQTPSALEHLPSTLLGSFGGGVIPIDPEDRQGLKTLEKTFQVDIELPAALESLNVGGRAYVRFNHGFEPLSIQWYRGLRRLFLRHFNV